MLLQCLHRVSTVSERTRPNSHCQSSATKPRISKHTKHFISPQNVKKIFPQNSTSTANKHHPTISPTSTGSLNWRQKKTTAQKCKPIIQQLTAATPDPKYPIFLHQPLLNLQFHSAAAIINCVVLGLLPVGCEARLAAQLHKQDDL